MSNHSISGVSDIGVSCGACFWQCCEFLMFNDGDINNLLNSCITLLLQYVVVLCCELQFKYSNYFTWILLLPCYDAISVQVHMRAIWIVVAVIAGLRAGI